MRFFLIFLCFLKIITVNGNESIKKKENLCVKAVNKKTLFKVSGIYGSSLEAEWHPIATYVLLKEMKRFKIIKREYTEKSIPWRFEFIEMVGGKTVVFVYHLRIMKSYCDGPNAFFVVRR